MKAHDLAKKLLEGPNEEVVTIDYQNSTFRPTKEVNVGLKNIIESDHEITTEEIEKSEKVIVIE